MLQCKTKEECIQSICLFPLKCKEYSHFSPLELVNRFQYAKFCAEITKKEIIQALKKMDGAIEFWLTYTEDKRWTPAWGISMKDKAVNLFYMSPAREIEFAQEYSDPFEACAILIRMEMEGLIRK